MSEVNFTDASGGPTEVAAQAEEFAKVDAARAELYDEATGANNEGLILGKYRTSDDLAQAYQNLQREYSRLKNGQQPEAEPESEVAAEPEDVEEADEDLPQVDPQVADAIRRSVLEQVGGEGEYQRLSSWAVNNLDPERTNAYNAALNAGDQASILGLLKGMQYDYLMKNGYEPKLTGGRAPSNEVKGFTSRYQVTEAMSDPRYEKDAGYRRDVERRIAASSDAIFGFQQG